MDNSRLVYSTDKDRIVFPEVNVLPEVKTEPTMVDGIVRIQRQTRGRRGKGVSLITGIAASDEQLNTLAAELKRKCGCGGAVKNGVIEIQGDKRDLLKQLLEAKGMKVKIAGG